MDRMSFIFVAQNGHTDIDDLLMPLLIKILVEKIIKNLSHEQLMHILFSKTRNRTTARQLADQIWHTNIDDLLMPLLIEILVEKIIKNLSHEQLMNILFSTTRNGTSVLQLADKIWHPEIYALLKPLVLEMLNLLHGKC